MGSTPAASNREPFRFLFSSAVWTPPAYTAPKLTFILLLATGYEFLIPYCRKQAQKNSAKGLLLLSQKWPAKRSVDAFIIILKALMW